VRLASVLVEGWQAEGQGGAPAPTEALEAALQAAVAAGRACWPELPVDERRFVRHLARSSLRGEHDPAAALAQLCVADLYLACACAAEVPGAAAAFEAAYLTNLAAAVAGAVNLTAAEIDEIRQQLRVKLLVGGGTPERPPLITAYSGRGPLGAWVRVAAVRTALTQARDAQIGARAGQRAASEALRAQVPADPELDFLKDRYRHDFAQAFQAALNAVDDRQRALLRLHFVAGLTLEKIGVIYEVDRSTVSRWLAQARHALLEATERNLRDQLGIAAGEFQSMARLLTSQLEIDLPELLRTSGG
jgi:RNA polymerase sigma-70 factor (ECF subfamily)